MHASLVLASASPRRKALLAQLGIACEQRPVNVDEQPLSGEDPAAYVQRLARMKAEACAGHDDAVSQAVFLAADTTVVVKGHILGKPRDRDDALRMLATLSGCWHEVHTGIAVLSAHGINLACVTTRVHMKPITAGEAASYWATGEPADKAGGYGIQGIGAVFIDRIEGSYSGVMGLPLMETAALLAQHGVTVWQEHERGH